MNVKISNTVTVFGVSCPKFGVGTKKNNQISQFSLPIFGTVAIFKLFMNYSVFLQ